jgi:hypothetical protein
MIWGCSRSRLAQRQGPVSLVRLMFLILGLSGGDSVVVQMTNSLISIQQEPLRKSWRI